MFKFNYSKLLFIVGLSYYVLISVNGQNVSREDWGYVEVRPGAHMFWWLYYTTAVLHSQVSHPLIIWLQGGPGASSTGFGNFEELGPLQLDLTPRNTTWVQAGHVLFIDNPVGTGYSYVSNGSAFATNGKEIADDLVAMMRGFYRKLPAFETSPLYIFSESYGAKMAADFALALHQAIQNNTIKANLKTVALGDGFVSPIDSALPYGPYLHGISVLDGRGLAAVNQATREVQDAIRQGNWTLATYLWFQVQNVVDYNSHGVDWYNILYRDNDPYYEFTKGKARIKKTGYTLVDMYNFLVPYGFNDSALDTLMNGPIRLKLGIPDNVTWGGQSELVFNALIDDFMKPSTDTVEILLNKTNVDVVVFNGQLDLICNTIGSLAWVDRLNWPGKADFQIAARKPIKLPIVGNVGYVKRNKNLAFYWILRAGHMVPTDAGEESLKMIDMIMNTNHSP